MSKPFEFTKQDIETMLYAYMVCALWSSTDDEGNPLDNGRCPDDFTAETRAAMLEDCKQFAQTNAAVLKRALNLNVHCGGAHGVRAYGWEQVGHDYWLTRNRHGAGFWGRGLPDDIGHALTDAAHLDGEIDLYVGDDGMVRA